MSEGATRLANRLLTLGLHERPDQIVHYPPEYLDVLDAWQSAHRVMRRKEREAREADKILQALAPK